MKHPRLLFITQKLHGQDVFAIQWIQAFEQIGYHVEVVCLEWLPEDAAQRLGIAVRDLPKNIQSLGKERGTGRFGQILRFTWLMWTLRYDRVFVHMTPVWGIFGAKPWIFRRKPVYLWYTHYQMQFGLRLIAWYGKRMFCATKQSMPQYDGHPKKMVVGHGVDMTFWQKRENTADSAHSLLVVHRLSRSKRLELNIRALALLDNAFTMDVYGMEAEQDYADEMYALVKELDLEDRVRFHGTVPMKDLATLYRTHRFLLNMASETIDKTMLECMTQGCYPVTTQGNAQAIGLGDNDVAPSEDTPEAIAAFIRAHQHGAPVSGDDLYAIVESQHSLRALIEKMDAYIRPGN